MKDWHICLAHLCTSDARELADALSETDETYEVDCGNFFSSGREKKEDPNYGHYKPLSIDLVNRTIQYYRDEIADKKESIVSYTKDKEDAEKLYLQATSQLVLDDLKGRIRNDDEMIAWCSEEIERLAAYSNYIADAVLGVLEENDEYTVDGKTNEYELVYYMG